MRESVAKAAESSHRLSLENRRPRMANADLKILERARRAWIGRAITRARGLAGLTQDELAGEIAKVLRRDRFDPAQVARWESGAERPQFDVLLKIAAMQWPVVQCLAELDPENEVVTDIRRRVQKFHDRGVSNGET